jgi:O-antigen/teichoic acid export membrane protein
MTESASRGRDGGAMGSGAGPWSTALRIASLLTSLLTVTVVARTQGEERFGSWTVAVAIVSGLLILDAGLGNALVRTSGRLLAGGHGHRVPVQLAASLRYTALRISGPVAVVAVAAAAAIVATDASVGELDSVDLGSSVLAVGLVGPALALLGMAPKVQVGLGRVPQSSRRGLIGCVGQLVVVLACAWLQAPLGLLVAANFTSQLIGWGLDTIAIRPMRVRHGSGAPDPELLRDGRRYQTLVLAGYAGFNADPLIVGAIVGPTSAGLVSLAARVILTPQMVVTSWFSPRWGTVARAELERPDEVRGLVLRTVVWGGAIATGATVAAGLLAGPLVRIIAGPDFSVPTDVVWATVASGVVLGIAAALAVALNGLGLVAQQLRLSVGSAAANLVLGVILCIRFGAVGAPLATAIAHGLIGVPMSLIALADRLRSNGAVEVVDPETVP